nr:MAG TPA: hypothetical protein [Caudoviricetes sp.]
MTRADVMKMGLAELQELQRTNPELYNKFFN